MSEYLLLAAVVAVITWTLTKEEITRPVRVRLDPYKTLPGWRGKLAYMPTCDYCTSHWVALGVVLASEPAPLVGAGVVGAVLSYFVLVALTAVYLTLYSILRQALRFVCAGAVVWERNDRCPHA